MSCLLSADLVLSHLNAGVQASAYAWAGETHSIAEAQLHYLGGRRGDGRFVLYPHFFVEILRLDQYIFGIKEYFGYIGGVASPPPLVNLSDTIFLQIDHSCVYTFV